MPSLGIRTLESYYTYTSQIVQHKASLSERKKKRRKEKEKAEKKEKQADRESLGAKARNRVWNGSFRTSGKESFRILLEATVQNMSKETYSLFLQEK